MNVCFFCGGFATNGGIGRVVSVLSDYFQRQEGVQTFLCSFYERKSERYYPTHKDSVKTELFSYPIGMGKALLFKNALGKFCKYIRENNIDLIISCGVLYYPLTVLAAKICKVKVICCEHISPYSVNDYKFQKAARNFGGKRSNSNVVLTKSALGYYLENFPKNKNYQIYNPADPKLLNKETAYDTSSKRIISVGRLSAQKDFSRLLDIAAVIFKKHPDWSWDIYGEGELRGELEEKKNRLGLNKNVFFCGQVGDIYDRYKDYSFIVMTSKFEGFPMTLVEGAAGGLPMVSFNIETGPDEIIKNGVNGFLCDKTSNEEMINAILRLIENKDLRISASYESRKTAEKFAIEKIYKQWQTVIENLE